MRAGLDVPHSVGLELRPVLRQKILVAGPTRPRAQGQEDIVDVAEIRAGVFDNAAKMFERPALRLEDGPDASIEWQPAEIDRPRHARALPIAIERRREQLRI